MSFTECKINKESDYFLSDFFIRTKFFYALFLIMCAAFLYSCDLNSIKTSTGDGSGSNIDSEWLVPEHEVIDGGPGRDGIPSIDNPKFAPANQIDFIPDERRVLGIKRGDEIRAYPIQILDWHEIVNDRFDGQSVAVTYCPLTATGIAWIPRTGSEYGTSGRIFRNNLVAYDRNTGNLWLQMRLRSIHGTRMGEIIEPLNVIETTWNTWKSMYPNSKVLTNKTGFSRDYQTYAYGEDYPENHGLILFPTMYRNDTRLNAKTRIHGIIADDTLEENSTTRVYEINKFGEGIKVLHDELKGNEYVIIGSTSLDFAIAYKTTMRDGTQLSFEPVQDELPVVMEDQDGNKWNIFGEAVDGPRSGQRLRPATSYSGYWFAFRDIFRLPEIYQFDSQ
jgi:hypothetical protein